MKTIYCISGLGADERIFGKLVVPGVQFKCIKWLMPEEDETLKGYSARMSQLIEEPTSILMGLSFGGMVAIEICKILSLSKVILLSSIKSRNELPVWLRACGNLHLDSMLPKKPIQSFRPIRALRPIQNWFLGAVTEEEKRIANEYRDSVDPVYLKWSINKVINYTNTWLPAEYFHIHGTNDHIFPVKNIRATHLIDGGGHFMVMNKHAEVSEVLSKIIYSEQFK